jgi:O-antigen/teichoic acid export membrane protein
MRIQDNLAKLSWTAADKALYIGYGLINILQNNALPLTELGLYTLCNALQTFIFAVSDGFVLQTIIVFGTDKRQRAAVNRFAMLWHVVITLGASLLLFAMQMPLARLLNEPRIATVAAYLPVFCILGIPRTLCLKYLYRDVQAQAIFVVNAVWIGTMSTLTAWMLYAGQLRTFEAMFTIAAVGMGASSCAAVWMTRSHLGWRDGTKAKARAGAESEQLLWRTLFGFGVYQGLSSVAANSVRQLDVTVVQYFFGAATLGVYQSAKTLFRFFDEGFSAIASLVYPTTVRLIYEKNNDALLALLSKMVSFSLAIMFFAVLLVEFGGAEFVIGHLLAPKYAAAVGYFKLLTLSALAMPFVALLPVMIALDAMRRVLFSIVLAVALALTTLVVVGAANAPELAPLGIVVFNGVLGALCFIFVRQQMRFPVRYLWRFVPDTLDFMGLWRRKE